MFNNDYNPFAIVTEEYHRTNMINEVLDCMIEQLGVKVSYEDLDVFFTSHGKIAIPNCEEWQHSFAFEKMLEYYHVRAQDETLDKQIEMMTLLADDEDEEFHG